MSIVTKLTPNKPLLILLYGYAGAGKTYFARQLCENLQAAHVQAERIRGELFEQPRYDKEEEQVITQLMSYMTEEFLQAGLSVVFDTNATRLAQRRLLREMARKAHAQDLLVWLQIDLESAYARASKRDRRRADDRFSAQLDRPTFDRLMSRMQNPKADEEYVVVSGKHTFNTQLKAFVKYLRAQGLITINEQAAKMVKPGLVNLIPNPAAGRVDLSRRNIVIR